MGKAAKIVIVENTLSDRFTLYMKNTNPGGPVDVKAKSAMGLQLINNVVNGSPGSSVTPPVLTGRLRASGSAFVGGRFVGDTSKLGVSGGQATPNRSYSEKNTVVTIGFNTEYAARWHERPFRPGPVSTQSGNVGTKYVEKHLKADGKEIFQLYADIVRRETSKL